jgi:hypothetical protein
MNAEPAPAWMIAQMSHKAKKARKPRRPKPPDAPLFGQAEQPGGDAPVPEGHRHKHLVRLAGTLKHRGASKEAIVAALLAENAARCRPPLPDDEVIAKAEDVADRYDPDPLAGVRVKLPGGGSSNGSHKAPPPPPPPPPPEEPQAAECLEPVPISRLSRTPPERKWLLEGYLARGRVTMLSALFKCGKTTWLAWLFKAAEKDGRFIGKVVRPCRVLIITEEHEDEWAERRDRLGLTDHIDVLVRPSLHKMTLGEWLVFLNRLKATQHRNKYDLIVIDPISNYWPVRDENSAAEVQAALMPLHGVIGEAALLLLHHLRKADGQEGTQTRGTGAIGGFVDLLVEMKRLDRSDLTDTRRVLTGTGRWRETPVELVVSLGTDGYSVHGDKADVRADDLAELIVTVLPTEPPGKTDKELLQEWPEEAPVPGRTSFLAALKKGVEKGRWQSTGRGVKNDPYRYFKAAPP